MSVQTSLLGLSRQNLLQILKNIGVEQKQLSMRLNQLWNWIYVRGAKTFDDMSNVNKVLKQNLAEQYHIERPKITQAQISADGTRKWLLKLSDGNLVEAVFIPDQDRGTLCISSQVGCTLNCSFCHTGTQKLVRNLTIAEIVSQIAVARDELDDWNHASDKKKLTNIVLMGMGEPLYNYENVRDAMHIIMDSEGIAIGKRRITLSTSGVVPFIEKAGHEIGCNLAISLHAVRDDLRNELVPLNKKYPIAELLDACRDYPTLSNARRITFEYVMLKNVNDSVQDAKELVKLLKNIPAKINLIPFNKCSNWETIEVFGDIVNRAGYASPIRIPRGRDILAACGQLKSASEKIRKSVLLQQK
jgi:23S rRNA (adenine2503-C2)-methyltransferase